MEGDKAWTQDSDGAGCRDGSIGWIEGNRDATYVYETGHSIHNVTPFVRHDDRACPETRLRVLHES